MREAHPGDRYPQAETLEGKMRHARDYQERDRLPWPVAVDDVDGTLHRALDPKPNAVYLVDTDGNVAFRSLWANHERPLRQALHQLLSHEDGPIGESQTRLVPMLAGTGKMDETWTLAGPQARRDVLREAPPMYGLARIASLFRPLPPLGRGIAATASGSLGAVATVIGVRRLRRALRRRDAR